MADATTITTEMRFDGNQSESFFDSHPSIALEGLSGIAGSNEAWSPPHLFVAAVESCFFLTMLPIAEKMHIRIATYASTAEGHLTRPDGKHTEVAEIVIRPKVSLVDEADRAKLGQLMKLAEEYCLVARSLKTALRIEGY
jgi:organic hydroperoxide reductase OsmC/OhrA